MTVPLDDQLTLNRQATVARLVSGAAHEVNNALQVISGSAELLLASQDLPEPLRAALERIAAHSARAAAAMTGVTALSRPITEARAPIDLRDVATRAASLKRYSVSRAGLTIALEAGDQPLQVAANGPQVLQAVVNLIENAEQALSGRQAGRIVIAASRDGSFARLTVSDDGPGLSPRDGGEGVRPLRHHAAEAGFGRPRAARGPRHRRGPRRNSVDGSRSQRRHLCATASARVSAN